MKTESNLNPQAVGPVGEVGLFQIRPRYSKYSRSELFNPHLNIPEGISKLSEFKQSCKHRIDNTWVICYNLGVRGASKVKYPKKFRYYSKFMQQYKKGITW